MLRPITRISFTRKRITFPPLVTSMIWSSSVTMRTPITRPVLSVVFMVMMPFPPRRVRRYSSISVRLP